MYAQTAGVVAHAASGFRPEFFLPLQSKADAPLSSAALSSAAPSDTESSDTGISYSRELHGSNRAFCASPAFPRYREEMRVLLDILTAFAIHDDMPAATRTAIADGFSQLYQRRFDAPYVEPYAELIDGPGKRALESICALVHDESIPLALRRATACNLSASLSVCQGGTLSNLLLAQRTLMTSAGGIRARLWKIKDECARALLLEAVHEKFHTRKEYLSAEMHYVNSAWNLLAGEFGLQAMNDPGADALLAGDTAFLGLCRARLLAGLTPENLATRLAEDCLGAFVGSAPEGARGAPYGAGIPAWFDSALESILLDLRLGADRLTLHAFVQLDEAGQRYRLRTDATLVAVALLDAIHAEGLMDHMPQYGGEWVDQDGQRAAMLVHGTLAWRASATGRGEARPVWNAAESAAELLTVEDLRRWKNAYDPFGDDVPAILLRAAIRADEPEALAAVPAAWLMDADTALQLLARMGDERANRYLETHVSHFLVRFPHDQRAAFIDGAMHRGHAAGLLACSWYADMYALLSETPVAGGPTRLQRWMTLRDAAAIDAVRDLADNGWGGATCPPRKAAQLAALMRGHKQTPILYEAMARGDAAGIAAWGRLLCSSAILPNIGAMLPDLLVADRQGGISALSEAMHKNCAASVAAYGAMLADARLLQEVHTQLPALLAGTGSRFRRTPHRATALMYGMDGGAVAAIEAYGELLVQPALLSRISKDIPKLFGISGAGRRGSARAYRRAPLWWAMNNGHAGAVGAFQRILTQAAVMDCMKPHLPDVLAGWDPAGRITALHAALRKDYAAAIDAYHAFLAHPDVLPRIRAALPELLRAEDSWGSPGLAIAASRGCARAIAAYHAILVDDAIWPTVRASLPGLLKARPLGEATGLAQALGAGHADVLKAYHAMLVDRKILPEIQHVLATLLIKRGVSGMTGLPLAVRGGYQPAIDAFRAILVDSRIEPYIGGAVGRRSVRSRRFAAARRPASVPEAGQPGVSPAWEGKVDQWLAVYLDSRAPRGGLLDRIVFWLQRWMV
ncbi:hypothetical protein CAL12_05175 [Bordetella genomosp. 8]|uniref:Uncharacterized protein n=1 Tax=Bordetella genomosp. 8 TaxID=1416806 RepID=A0A1W6YIA6_9BORD|nr:hypothetical protein [Bordetella genomosp. 8]ARP80283.1 hypothetical protein CAL12_05175 [Bordetella genomosp. 8]